MNYTGLLYYNTKVAVDLLCRGIIVVDNQTRIARKISFASCWVRINSSIGCFVVREPRFEKDLGSYTSNCWVELIEL